MKCNICNKELSHRDYVNRIQKIARGEILWIRIERQYCKDCGTVHRLLPENVLPFKHYEASVIKGVINGDITPDTDGFEDYPCEMTMTRWRSE